MLLSGLQEGTQLSFSLRRHTFTDHNVSHRGSETRGQKETRLINFTVKDSWQQSSVQNLEGENATTVSVKGFD